VLPAELAAAGARGGQAGLARSQVPLELGQARHDGAHQLAARGAEIEAEAHLSQDANFPAMQIVEALDEVLHAPASTRKACLTA
jgi:hypothetical protein